MHELVLTPEERDVLPPMYAVSAVLTAAWIAGRRGDPKPPIPEGCLLLPQHQDIAYDRGCRCRPTSPSGAA